MYEVYEDCLQIESHSMVLRVKTPLFICEVGYKFHHNQMALLVLAVEMAIGILTLAGRKGC